MNFMTVVIKVMIVVRVEDTRSQYLRILVASELSRLSQHSRKAPCANMQIALYINMSYLFSRTIHS